MQHGVIRRSRFTDNEKALDFRGTTANFTLWNNFARFVQFLSWTLPRALEGKLTLMKIATWNVNSLKVRLPQVLDWLAANPIDLLCLQETKLTDDRFPAQELAAAGYRSMFSGQPTYNGVASLWRADTGWEPQDVVLGNPLFPDEQKRLISASLGGMRVVCAYVPNGQAVGSDKYDYKLRWLEALTAWLGSTLAVSPRLVVAGDYNIAPDDQDVHDPQAWAGQVLCSQAERDHFRALLALGFHDAWRLFEQAPKSFTWWDYRQLGFRLNKGLRIDHLLVSQALRPGAQSCVIDRAPRKLEKPSDHAPVILELDPGAL